MTGVAAPTGSHVLRSPSEATHRDFARKQHQDLGIGWDPKDSTGGAWPGKLHTGSHEADSNGDGEGRQNRGRAADSGSETYDHVQAEGGCEADVDCPWAEEPRNADSESSYSYSSEGNADSREIDSRQGSEGKEKP